MNVDGSVLRDLHRILRQQNDLRGQLDRGPRQLKAMAANVVAAAQALEDGKLKHRQLRMESDRKQLQLRERENKIKDLEVKLNQSKSNREYQTLKEQIAADKQANNVLSDEILEAMEQIDLAHAQIGEFEKKLAQLKEEEKKLQSQIADRMKVVEAELGRVTAELQRVETGLPPDVAPDYQRAVSSRGEDGLAEVDGQSCGGCYQVLSPQIQDRLRQNVRVICTSCGRLLYLPEERSLRSR